MPTMGKPSSNVTFDYKDVKVTYDSSEVHSWKTQRALASGEHDPYHLCEAIDRVLCGKADEVADEIGGTIDAMVDLMSTISEREGGSAKN